MNGNGIDGRGIPTGPVPLLGQREAAQQAAVMQVYHAMFAGVLSAVAQARLDGCGYAPGQGDYDLIALEADRIAVAGMKRLGVNIQKPDIPADPE